YTVSSTSGAATVAVADNDVPQQQVKTPESCGATDAALVAKLKPKTLDPWKGARADLLETFTRAYRTMIGEDDYTVADIKARPDRQDANWQGAGPNPLWQQVYAELDRLEACRAADDDAESESDSTSQQQQQVVTPEISVRAGAGVVEGGSASFTITADPAPSSPLTVTLSVSQTGDFGAATGSQTVTIPTSGSMSVAVATVGDSVDEAHGSVDVTLQAASGYTLSASQGAASVAVSDDDDPPPPPSANTPTVSVEDAEGDEGWSILTFQVTLSEPSNEAVRISWQTRATRDSSLRPAHVGFDYLANSGTIVIAAGQIVGYADVFIESDQLDEGDEHFEIQLTSAQGASIADAIATMTIDDDD
ncbi:MAG: hypothetical protein OXG27_06275, partial [Chloroflexi bacterium]|nr:hypothetical protein [Chloroflexota bacterium]